MMKKAVLFLLAICMCLTLFVACGDDSSTNADQTAEPTAALTMPPTIAPTQGPTPVPTATPAPTPVYDYTAADPEVDAFLYRFYDPENYMWKAESFISTEDTGSGMTAKGEACVYYYDDNSLCVEVLIDDPYFLISATETGEKLDLSQYPVFKIRMKNETVAEAFEAFAQITAGAKAADNFRFDISSEDNDYVDYIFDISTLGQDFLDARKEVYGIRLDGIVIDAAQLSECDAPYFYVQYFGFFKTVEDAENWNPGFINSAKPVEG